MISHLKLPASLYEDRQVLDIGCGRTKLKGSIGLDYLNLPGVDVVADLTQKLPFEDNRFDVVHANQVLEHMNDIIHVMYEVLRILKPGGLFVAHVPHFRSAWAHIDPTHVKGFTINTLDYFVKGTYCYENYRFREGGFSSIQVFLDNDYPSTLLRKFFSTWALKRPFQFENSIWSNIYPFEQISYLLKK
jgi:ubiquinone/menaquinone biosynthesis C-methylase UbiE